MLVTGRRTGATLAPPLLEALERAGIGCVHFSQVEANPTVAMVEQIRKLYVESGCQGFVAMGGGSPMDAAKGAAARAGASPDAHREDGGAFEGHEEAPALHRGANHGRLRFGDHHRGGDYRSGDPSQVRGDGSAPDPPVRGTGPGADPLPAAGRYGGHGDGRPDPRGGGLSLLDL